MGQKVGLKINLSKCARVGFTLNRLVANGQCDLHIDNEKIAEKKTYRYLGVSLDEKLTFKLHTTKIGTKIHARAKKLNWLIGPNSLLTRNTKDIVIKQLIMPLWQYALPVWVSLASDTSVHKVQSAANRVIRRALGYDMYTRNKVIKKNHNLKTLDDTYKEQSHRFFTTATAHTNPAVKRLAHSPVQLRRIHKSRPRYARLIRDHLPNLKRWKTPGEAMLTIPPTFHRLQKDGPHTENRLIATSKPPNLMKNIIPPAPFRFCGHMINHIRRNYMRGIITRAQAIDYVRTQAPVIRQLVIPDYGPGDCQDGEDFETQKQKQATVIEIDCLLTS